VLYLISRPFAFIWVKHPTLTPFLRFAPLSVAAIFTVIYWIMPIRPALTGDGSLSRHMITVFAILPGFFIAALAAVSTFNRPEMDEVMPDPAPELKLRTGEHESYVPLTARMFTTHLFSYLTSISFFAVFLFVCADLSSPSISYLVGLVPDQLWRDMLTHALALAYFACVIWLAAKIVLTTLIGLYFLAERIHRPFA
jgi:hypothetical protein